MPGPALKSSPALPKCLMNPRLPGATATCSFVVTVTFTQQGGTFYVSLAGSDTNPGTIALPFATIAYGVKQLRPGNTLYMRAGVYTGVDQVIDSQTHTVPSGPSWANPITIAGYPGEAVVIKPPNAVAAVRFTTGAPSYIILQDFAVDYRIAGQDVMPHLRTWSGDSVRFTNVTDQTNEGRTSDAEFTTLARELGRPISVDEVRPHAADALAGVFGLALEELPADDGPGLWSQPTHEKLATSR